MANIASFGTPRPEDQEEDTFEYFGEVIRLNPDFSELDYLDFLEEAGGIDEMSVQAVTATKGFLKTMVHPEDFGLWWQTARRNKQGIQDLMLTANQLLTVMTGRPTEAPSGSSAGRPVTTVSSKLDSSSPESPLTDMDRRVIDRKLAEGRTDTALAVLRSAEHRQRVQQAG